MQDQQNSRSRRLILPSTGATPTGGERSEVSAPLLTPPARMSGGVRSGTSIT
jgi:hypothetical protein